MDRVRDLVAAGGVSVVLAQDRDRFAREPAYHYLLRREFEEHGTKIRALNDRGDDSPGGRAHGRHPRPARQVRAGQDRGEEPAGQAAEGPRGQGDSGAHGPIRRAPATASRFNDARDALVVDEEKMAVVRRIFRMVGVEGQTIFAAKRTLDAAGIPTATGKPRWSASMIRDIISNDVYRPHSFEEVEPARLAGGGRPPRPGTELRPVEVGHQSRTSAPRSRRSAPTASVSTGTRHKRIARPEEEWVYVPVPDSGVPREWVDAAREAIKDNRKTSNAGRRFWELSGGILRCGECGWTMHSHNVVSVGQQTSLLLQLQGQVQARTGLLPGDPHPPCRETRGPGMGARSAATSKSRRGCERT